MRIYRRAGVWYYVRRVPCDLLEVVGRPVICRSLKTKDKKSAKTLAAAQDFHIEQILMMARSGMLSKERIKKIVADYLSGALERYDDILMRQDFPDDPGTQSTVDAMINKAKQGPAAYKAELSNEFGKLADYCEGQFLQDDFSAVADLGDELLNSERLILPESDRQRLYRELLCSQVKLFRALAARVGGDHTLFDSEKTRAEADSKKTFCSFSQLIAEFEASEKTKRAWKTATLKQFQAESALLLELVGDLDLSEVNQRNTVVDCWTVLQKYPANRKKIFKDLPLKEILRKKNYKIMDVRTINRYMMRFSDLIKFALKEGLLESNINYAEGRQIKLKRLSIDDRLPYDKNDIKKLIDAICSKELWSYGKNRDDRFWIILIALFQGFNTAEIVNLRKSSIVTIAEYDNDDVESEYVCFDLIESGKKESDRASKTESRRRIAPVHEKLIEFGFLKWIMDKKKSDARLFKDDKNSFGAWYNRNEQNAKGFAYKYVTTDDKKVFYSLRHSFTDELKRADVPEYKIQALMGHALNESTSSISVGRYGGPLPLWQMVEAQKAIRYRGVDFSAVPGAVKRLFNIDL